MSGSWLCEEQMACDSSGLLHWLSQSSPQSGFNCFSFSYIPNTALPTSSFTLSMPWAIVLSPSLLFPSLLCSPMQSVINSNIHQIPLFTETVYMYYRALYRNGWLQFCTLLSESRVFCDLLKCVDIRKDSINFMEYIKNT